MDMRSKNSDATINQTGTGNYSRYEIIGDSQSNTDTPGDNNDLTVTQNRTFTGTGTSDNQFSGYVAGDNNAVGVTQTGEGNRIGSTGSADFGLVIDGDGNNLTLQQTGRDNLSNIRIDDATSSADNNVVSINQNNTVNTQGNTIGIPPSVLRLPLPHSMVWNYRAIFLTWRLLRMARQTVSTWALTATRPMLVRRTKLIFPRRAIITG